mmetsp:Transcript_11991/g.20817  ORF Transcript_11991/g.20817 Transcript_11991/m.20817 type:complete len:206 (+) Transcript_11991:1057-1674(+)
MPGGMPFIKNSTATSGLPLAARRHAMTADSGNPRALRLLITSAGNSSGELASEVATAGAGVEAAGAAAVAAGAAGVGGFVVVAAGVVGAAVAGAGASAVVDAAAGAAAAGLGAGAFLAFAIMTTRKSFGLILQLSILSSSFKTLPEWINFMLAAGSSDLAVSMTVLTCATVFDGSTSMVNLPPLSVFTVRFILLIIALVLLYFNI